MFQLIAYLLVGAILVALMALVSLRGSGPEGRAEELVRARHALTLLETNLLPPDLVERFCSAEDYEFVAASASADVAALFRGERKKIMLAWTAQIRRQIYGLLRFHLGAARFYTRLNFRSEASLAMDFSALLIACRALQILVYFGGPFIALRMVDATATAALRICDISERALAFMTAPDPPVERSIAS
jgi:hypothetical protein